MSKNPQAVKRIGAIILAAGNSSRLGQPKQQLLIEGKPLLLRIVEIILASAVDDVVVVLGHAGIAYERSLAHLPVGIVQHPEWSLGMGSSIKAGLRYLIKHHQPDGALVFVCDQPFLTKEHVNRLIRSFVDESLPVVASRYMATVGVPAIFDKGLFEELLCIDDNAGARNLIGKYKPLAVEFPGGELDIDTERDYHEALRRIQDSS